MAKMAEMKRCPFCGGDVWMENVNDDMWVFIHQTNGSCILDETDFGDLVVFDECLDEFIAAWNRRADG